MRLSGIVAWSLPTNPRAVPDQKLNVVWTPNDKAWVMGVFEPILLLLFIAAIAALLELL
jgi:hypothetical protein